MRRCFLPIIPTSLVVFKEPQEATFLKKPQHFYSSLKPYYQKNPAEKYGIYGLNPARYHLLYHHLLEEFPYYQESSSIILHGTNTCATINGAMQFANYSNFLITIKEECFPFFLFGNKLMIAVTEDLGEQLNSKNFDFSAVMQKIRTDQGNKIQLDISSFISSIEKKQDLLQSEEMAVFIQKVCLRDGANDFIACQPEKRQNFYKLLQEQILYLYEYQQINLLDIQRHLQYPACEAQFFLGLENIDQVIVANEEDPKKTQEFCDNLQRAKQHLLQNEEYFEEYFNYRKNIIKFKQDLLKFLEEVEKNPAEHCYFSSKIEKSADLTGLSKKIKEIKQQTEQDLEYLQEYFKDSVKIKEDLAKPVQITYQEPSPTLKTTYLKLQEVLSKKNSSERLSMIG